MDDVERLARIATELVVRVRDEDPEANGRWLAAELPDPADWFRLAFVLAAAVPDDKTWLQLTAWAGEMPSDREVPWCGRTGPYGARRHRSRYEPVCGPCREAERKYDAARRARPKDLETAA